ncbi:hypothetical protein DPEC_G00015890 [Dallia pectoralis]|uniref:Uncharacterized protein n=1 Tax=Dallia pectoralis TaxID=75939 RepID=A0ACC2HMT0_DALPE|nr:hypothetical protein DPEC_G00015890 [Dallia pectoralis]
MSDVHAREITSGATEAMRPQITWTRMWLQETRTVSPKNIKIETTAETKTYILDALEPSLFQVGTGGRFRCPTCRHEVVLDRHGVYGLQRNLLVENIIDVYKKESASSRPEPPKPVLEPTCEEHDGEKLNIFCITCQVPRCSFCKVFGAHKTCQVKPLIEVYQQQKAELNEEVSCLTASNNRVQAFISELEMTRNVVEENCETQKRTVCEKFDRMLAIMDERRRIMTQQITDEQEEKTGHVRALVQSYGEKVENNTKLVETAMTTAEEPEMAVFVQNSKQLIVKVKEASHGIVVKSLEPGYDNMEHYEVNFTTAGRALNQIDFIKDEEEEGQEEMEEEEDEGTEHLPGCNSLLLHPGLGHHVPEAVGPHQEFCLYLAEQSGSHLITQGLAILRLGG